MQTSMKQKFLERGFDLDAFLKKLDFRKTPAKYKKVIRELIHDLPKSDKKEVLSWLEAVEDVRNDKNLSSSEKKKALTKLKTSETVLNFFKSVADLLIEKVPFKNKDLIRTVLAGATLAASFTQLRWLKWAGVSILVLKQLLPHLLLLDKFGPFATFLKNNLEQELGKDPSQETSK
ncbi:MAG: hypothetical protein ACK5P7_04775 [Bdellovibrio sp.]